MKIIILLTILVSGITANAQMLYRWSFTNATDTFTNSTATYAIAPGTGNLVLQNVSGNISGATGADAVNPLLYFTNAIIGPQPGPSGVASLVANGQGYNGGNTAVATATNLNLGSMYQFTLTFWFQMGATTFGQFPRFVLLSAETNYDSGGKGPTVNGVGASVNTAPTGFPCVQNGVGNASTSQNPIMSVTNIFPSGLPTDGSTWVFEAITYDGTLNQSNFITWIGTASQPIQLVTGGAQNAPYGAINFTTNAAIMIGNDNIPALPRALNTGGIADVRIYAGTGNSNQLDVIRQFGFPPIQANSSAPAIVNQPYSGTSFVNGTRYFSVTASGTPSPTYSWKSNGVPVVGATGATLVVSNVQLAASGSSFVCSITNALGGTNTIPAILTVTPVSSGGDYAKYVVSQSPYSFWEVNEPSNGVPVPVFDYVGGHDGFAVNPANMSFSFSGPTNPTFYGFPTVNSTIETIAGVGQSRLNAGSPGNYPNSGMTIAGWVNTPGYGNTGYGLIYNEASDIGPFFGLTFGAPGSGGGNGSEVDYIWGTATPAFTSGICMNTNEWTFAALVISTNAAPDTNATIYVGSETLGLLSTHDSTAASGDIIVSGSDPNILALGRATPTGSENNPFPYAGTTSQFNDVAVFYSALSSAAISNLFLNGVGLHLNGVKDPSTPGNLLLNWSYGYLQSASIVSGPYADVPLTTNGVPYSTQISGTKFYKVSATP